MHKLSFTHDFYSFSFDNENDLKKALILLWDNKFGGWWHYGAQMRTLGICTEDEFAEALFELSEIS